MTAGLIVNTSTESLAEGFLCSGMFEQVMQIVKPQVMSKAVNIVGASGYTHEDIIKVIDHINAKKTNISTMVTQTYKLKDIQAAFNKAIAAKETIKDIVDLT